MYIWNTFIENNKINNFKNKFEFFHQQFYCICHFYNSVSNCTHTFGYNICFRRYVLLYLLDLLFFSIEK